MTIRELIKVLQEYGSLDLSVLVDGYEGGYDSVAGIRAHVVAGSRYNESWMGEFDDHDMGVTEGEPFTVVIIHR